MTTGQMSCYKTGQIMNSQHAFTLNLHDRGYDPIITFTTDNKP